MKKYIAFVRAINIDGVRITKSVGKNSEQNLPSVKSEADDFAMQGSVFSNRFIEKILKVEDAIGNIEKYQQETSC